MFHYISMAAENPFRVAKVMAELTRGQFFEYPVTPGAYRVTFQDEYGSGIEVLPKDTVWTPGVTEAETQATELSRFSATRAALSVTISQEAIEAIGAREGWLVRRCDGPRGRFLDHRGRFQVMELWIENNFMLELLTHDMRADYINFMKPDAYASF